MRESGKSSKIREKDEEGDEEECDEEESDDEKSEEEENDDEEGEEEENDDEEDDEEEGDDEDEGDDEEEGDEEEGDDEDEDYEENEVNKEEEGVEEEEERMESEESCLTYEATREEDEIKKRLEAFGDGSRLQDSNLAISFDEGFNVPCYTTLLFANYSTLFEETEHYAHTFKYLQDAKNIYHSPNKQFEDDVTVSAAIRASSSDYLMNCLFNGNTAGMNTDLVNAMTSELQSLPEHLKVRRGENGAFYLGVAMLVPKKLDSIFDQLVA